MVSTLTKTLARTGLTSVRGFVALQSLLVFLIQTSDLSSQKRENIYNILWVVVFGFATINILGLIARRFDPRRAGLNFGEILAITVVVVSVFLLSWEMLYLFHILPIKLEPH
jgi:glucan phosphoethanolaminetransferase (alkaline phosphatase superfamily)